MRKVILASAFCCAMLHTLGAAAQEGDASIREAAKHFRRGVGLYSESNFSGALVEFERAYGLVPNAAVLYNIGQTDYQLRDYVSALKALRRFLAEASPTDSHRAQVERDMEVLRARVGQLRITTVPVGADVSIDGKDVGKTPLEPQLVRVGLRKVTASFGGGPSIARFVDVASNDDLSVALQLPESPDAVSTAPAPAPAPAPEERPLTPSPAPSQSHGASTLLLAVAWSATGALAGGAIGCGAVAARMASDLNDARNTLHVSRAVLDRDASATATYSILADSFTAAAILLGGLSLYWTLSSPASEPPAPESAPVARVAVGPASIRLETTF
jgi:hypothetical protein